jgi:membrane-associated phospholipid phosphatase
MPTSTHALSRFALTPHRTRARRAQLLVLVGLTLYLGVTECFIGLRPEHWVLATACLLFTLVGGRALQFLLLFLPVVLTGISYDLFRLATPLRGDIHVADLYGAELALFGIGERGSAVIPAQFFASHHHPVADFVTGLSYLTYLYVPMVVAGGLFFRDRKRMLLVGLAFLFTNLLGLAVYLAYPAAPPWYVFEHGLGPAQLDAAPHAAGAARFDELLGITYFQSFYARSANVFGAMPSLHVAYPASTMLAVAGLGKRWVWPLALFTLLVAFAAVYLQHHYVLDLVAGAACAGAGFIVARVVLRHAYQTLEVEHARPVE